MLVGAVAGETSSLSVYEKQEVMNCCINHNNNRIPLIVGCSAQSQKDRIALHIVENAEKKGYYAKRQVILKVMIY